MLGRWRVVAVILGVVSLIAAALWVNGVVDRRRFDAAWAEAKAAIAGGKKEEARRLLADVARRWPARDEVEFLLGASELGAQHLEAADAAFSRVPAGSPLGPTAALYRARLALRADRLAVAEPLLVAALKAKGSAGIEAVETLVNIYKIEGRYAEARDLVLGAWDSYQDKAAVLREAERLGSNDPMPVADMRVALERASRNAPDDDRVALGWANYATRTGQLDEARRRLDGCLRRRPEDPAVWRARLDLAYAIQDPAEVEQALRHLPPGLIPGAELLSLRAWFAAMSGDEGRERRAQEAVLALEPGDLKAMERLADIASRSGRPDEAARLRALRAELARLKLDYNVRLFQRRDEDAADLAAIAERLGRRFEAANLWTIHLKAHPGDLAARAAIARLQDEQKKLPAPPTLAGLLAELEAAPKAPTRSAPAAFAGTIPRFVDDAEAAGLRFRFVNGATPEHHLPETMSGGVGLLDYDGDGRLDVYFVQGEPFPADPDHPRGAGDRLFRNKGDGTFEDATARAGLAGFARGYGHGVAVGDFDGDGHPDLFVTYWRRYGLYRNKGDGTFEDATARAGLAGDRDWPTSAAFADLDDDGDLDLYVCHYADWDPIHPHLCRDEKLGRHSYCPPQVLPSEPDHLFRNDGGRFVDVSGPSGIAAADKEGHGLGVVAADLDGDGRVDLFVANDQSANFFFRNEGGMEFEDLGLTSGLACNADGLFQASMGVAHGDVDGDGLIDLAKTNFFNESTTLYQNRGGGVFVDATASIGLAAPSRYLLGFGTAMLDANDDGWPDLATANGHVDDYRPETPYAMPAQLLVNVAGRRLVDVSAKAGPPWAVPRVARGMAAGDLDGDGRVDLVVVAQDGPAAYFRNRTEGGGHWLSLELEGTKSNRDAVGARVVVEAGGRRRSAWRVGGGSYQSADGPGLHFGLGETARVDSIEVAWPSGRVDRLGPLDAGAAYRLREGDPAPVPSRPGAPVTTM